MRQQVEKAGMKAVLVNFQDFNGLKKTVRITASVIGGNAPKIAETYISELDDNINFVNSRLKNIPENRRPTVLHITGSTNLTEIDGGKSMIGEWIRLAGGRSVLAGTGNKAVVSLEEIIKADPEIIIVGSGLAGASAAAALAAAILDVAAFAFVLLAHGRFRAVSSWR